MARVNLLLLLSILAAWVLGLVVFPIELTTREVLHQIYVLTGLIVWTLMAECIVLAARPAWLERVYGESLERLMKGHRTLGWWVLAVAIAHFTSPLYAQLIPATPVPMMGEHKMDTFWEAVWIWSHPICALSGVLVTFWILWIQFKDVRRALGRVVWEKWEPSHRKWAWAFILMAPHCLRLPKECEMIMPLGWINLAVTILGVWAAIGIIRRRPGWMRRKGATVVGAQAAGTILRLTVATPAAKLYEAGHTAYLSLPKDSEDPHPFSVAGIDRTAGTLFFRIREAGAWTKALAGIGEGAPIEVEGPWGDFAPDFSHAAARETWIAAGCGVAPFLSWLEAAAHHRSEAPDSPMPAVTLLWSIRAAGGEPDLEEIRALCERAGVTLALFETGAESRRVAMRDVLATEPERIAVCGSHEFVESLRAAWREAGRSADRFRSETN